MTDQRFLKIHTVLDPKPMQVPYTASTTAEDVCIHICKQLNIGTIARHLFALRISGKQIFIKASATFNEKNTNYDFRVRFKVASVSKLLKIDSRAYDYFFHQARNDVLENKVPEIVYEKHRRELIGLGITDMYRVMLEKDIPRETVENEYKKYIPREVLKRHVFFIKKPIHDTLGKLQKTAHDTKYVKAEYLKQLEIIAPEYLSESYKALTDLDGAVCEINLKISTNSGVLLYSLDSDKDNFIKICTIEELGYISIRDNDGTVEISRGNGIPFYIKFQSLAAMFSFISLLDGYYRLTCKWTFNICKDVLTPSLQKLYAMKCHGPVGGEFSYAKLEDKRGNHPGSFIIRESESNYNIYYIDVCMKDSLKPKTFKLERITGDEFIFNDDLTRYRSIFQLMSAYNDPNGAIYLQECLPPSEYDKSPLLLCQSDSQLGDSLTDQSALNTIIPTSSPLCINSKDLQVYKGLEYSGDVSRSESLVRCQSWSSNEPHKVDEKISDRNFSDFSRKKARNYCRNPTRDFDLGPWCYTMNLDLKYETCGLSLCASNQCKISGIGADYAGNHSRGVSDRKCLKWNKKRKKVLEEGVIKSYEKFEDIRFPDENIAKAKKYCRNPNGDIGGPWCFVENEDTYDVEKEYCDIQYCDGAICEILTRSVDIYSHYNAFNESETNFTFGLKLWNSDSYLNASASLILSYLALPLTGKQIGQYEIGLEIYISNEKSALRFGNKDSRPDYEETPGILKSHEYTWFTLTWQSPFITLGLEGEIKPIFLAEYKTKHNLLGFNKNKFRFYSATGDLMLWQFPFCEDDDVCIVETTLTKNFQQFRPLFPKELGRELQFHLRGFHSIYLKFTPTPSIDYPQTLFEIQRHNQISRITVYYNQTLFKVVKELNLANLLDYWEWREFSISFFADSMQFYWTKASGTATIFELNHQIFKQMRYFSQSSETVAHWTFFCEPPISAKPPDALLPECALNKDENSYRGTQDVTSDGLACLHWSLNLLPDQNINSSLKLSELNYCRDFLDEKRGAYCYNIGADGAIVKNYCKIRKCKSQECRMAGTGNDYIGSVYVTRSNRSCSYWIINNNDNSSREVEYLNETLFADKSLEDVKNYCRNPSRNPNGIWCYTNDTNIPKDLCDIGDCDRDEAFIIIANHTKGRSIYVLPQWKISGLEFALKQWNPDLIEGVFFNITPRYNNETIRLEIGANNNEIVAIYINNILKKEKTLPHLISSGKWSDFWLIMRKGEISLGFKGVPNSLFEYKSEQEIFDPMFFNYGSLSGYHIGFFFKSDECQTEIVSTSEINKIYPIGIWRDNGDIEAGLNNIEFNIRGRGIIAITFFILSSDLYKYHVLMLDQTNNEITLYENSDVITHNKSDFNIFNDYNWTSYTIEFGEFYFKLEINGTILLLYTSDTPRFIFYYFSVTTNSDNSVITFSPNCKALDIDGPPRDGGWSRWSPWQCSVTCGGGEGFRTRTCTNPTPNILGRLCIGAAKSTGICNDFTCGDISPQTLETMRENLQTHYYSYVVDQGKSIVIENDAEMLKIIEKESPNSYYEWTLNGIYIKPSYDKMRGHDLVINNVDKSDSGVYVAMIYRPDKLRHRAVLRVVSLAVISDDFDVKTRATRSLNMRCNCVVLGYIYSDLSLKLLLNGNVYKDFGVTMLAVVNSEYFASLNESHNGDWKCLVEQKDLKLSWVTNYVKLEVRKAPNFYTNLMEDEATAPLFSWLETETNVFYALIAIAVSVLVLVLAFLFIYFKFCTLKSRWQ